MSQESIKQPGRLAWFFLALMLAGSVASLIVAVQAGLADVQMLKARWQITAWQSNPRSWPSAVDIGQARNDLVAAAAWTPGDPQIHESLAYLYFLRAQRAQAIPDLEQGMLAQAIDYYRLAITRRPMSGHAWASLAQALDLKGDDPDALWESFDRAGRYGRQSREVQRILAEIGFKRWPALTAARREQLLQILDQAVEPNRSRLLAIAAKHRVAVAPLNR